MKTMEEIVLKITEKEFDDLRYALIIAMKHLDQFNNKDYRDHLLADRLEIFQKKIEEQEEKQILNSSKSDG